jgi:hypothetical protein
MILERIVSGGQTGVDRAALDAALLLNIACGGWCPSGRRAEDGIIPKRYPLEETPENSYVQRTEWNVRDSNGTLILCRGKPAGGTAYTVDVTRQNGKPLMVVNLAGHSAPEDIRLWLCKTQIEVLNVAGPRESQAPGIYEQALKLMLELMGHR